MYNAKIIVKYILQDAVLKLQIIVVIVIIVNPLFCI